MKRLGFFLAVVFILLTVSAEARNIWNGVYYGKVAEVQDGDTVIVSPGPGEPLYQCRLYGIDTPEIRKKKRAGQPYSKEAAEEMEKLVLGKRVRVYMTGRQTFGREVCLLELVEEDVKVNLEMVKRGYAWAYVKYLRRPYASVYIYHEKKAREQKLGLWKDGNPEPPWEFRKKTKKQKNSVGKKEEKKMKEGEKIVIRKGEGNALTVIDMQNDFVNPDGALFVRGVEGEEANEQIIPRINNLIVMPFDWIALSKDKHPDDHIEFSIFGKHCSIMTAGSDFVSELKRPEGGWEVIEKGYDKDVISYSIVTSAAFPGHMKHLRAKGIKRVFVCGLAYTHCVGESAIAYAAQGFETYVIRDATRSVPPPYGDPEAMSKKLALYNVKLINFADIA